MYNTKSLTLEFYDTYNEEKVSNIKFPKFADIYLILFQVVDYTLKEVQNYLDLIDPEKPRILVGTKIDLRDNNFSAFSQIFSQSISTEDAQNFAKENNLPYMECSSLTSQGLNEIIEHCIESKMKINKSTKQKKLKSKSCCIL